MRGRLLVTLLLLISEETLFCSSALRKITAAAVHVNKQSTGKVQIV